MTEEVELYQTFSLVRASAKVLVSVAKSSVTADSREEQDKGWRSSHEQESLFNEPGPAIELSTDMSKKISSLELQISVLKQKRGECQLEKESLEHIVKKQRASATQWKAQELEYRNRIEEKDAQIEKLEEQGKYTAEMTKFFQKSLQAMQNQAEETQRVKVDLETEVSRLKQTHQRIVLQRGKMEEIVLNSRKTLKRARDTEAQQTIEMCQLKDEFSRSKEKTHLLELEIEKERGLRKEREAIIETAQKENEELISQINNREEILLATQALVASQRELMDKEGGKREAKDREGRLEEKEREEEDEEEGTGREEEKEREEEGREEERGAR